jgi:phosphonopyruvate decarboxylase
LIKPKLFFECLKKNDISFYSGVPDSLLKDFCAYVSDHSKKKDHFIAANEGNALAIGIGHFLSTKKLPLIYMQNSGLGNIINPLLSLADPEIYSIPMIILIGWRGQPNKKDEPQHKKQGRITKELLRTMEIPYKIIGSETSPLEMEKKIKQLVNISKKEKKPCAVLVKKDTFSKYTLKKVNSFSRSLYREQAIEEVVKALNSNEVLVSTTGVTSRELYEIREKYNLGHKKDFLTVGGMGHASQIALGIALEKIDREIFCLDGDGAFLMHMGAVAINGNSKCKNFKHIIFNNSAHDSVGAQPTVAEHLDLLKIADACGYNWKKRTKSKSDLKKKNKRNKKSQRTCSSRDSN